LENQACKTVENKEAGNPDRNPSVKITLKIIKREAVLGIIFIPEI
jgi:hypothetical protein